MRAVVVSERGGPESLAVVDLPTPRPGPGEVVVDVTAAGVNFLDVYQRTGYYQKPLPFTPGVEGCGLVAAIGPGVNGVGVGDRVGWVLHTGAYAERMVILAERLVPVPAELPDTVAAAGLMHGMAARYLTTSTYQVGTSDTVLVHAATGGMRLLVAQLAKMKGARVIATAATAELARSAWDAGADAVLLPREQDIPAQARRLTGGAGVDVVYDGIGRVSFSTSLACLRPRGTLVLMAELSGRVPAIDPSLLTVGSFFLTRPVLTHHVARRHELEAAARDVLTWLGDGTLTPRMGRKYPLEEAAAAHRDLEARRDSGKPVILPQL
ncbi:MAG: quinone oxidoreductase [Streptosporangiaceae bacterium]|nr:quinone oxidoreductase [Streptosporangiaceae bacterium]